MPGPRRSKLVAAALGTLLAGALVAVVAERLREAREEAANVSWRIVEQPAAQPAERAVHSGDPAGSTGARRSLSDAEFAAIRELGRLHQRHASAGFHYRAGVSARLPFAEHPRGEILIHTNELGFKGPTPVRRERPGLRVLVVGDSHTDGVCDDAESFCALLEGELRAAGLDVELLNAAVGGYTFDNYVGSLERCRELEPDVAVAVVYGGNDFYETLPYAHTYAASELPRSGGEYVPRLTAAGRLHIGATSQGLVQAHYFAVHPEQVRVALAAAQARTREFVELCVEMQAQPLIVYLPPAHEVQSRIYDDQLSGVSRVLELDESDLARVWELAAQWRADVARSGAALLDLRATFESEREALYWRSDLHLNLRGHQVVARELAPLLLALPRRSSPRANTSAPEVLAAGVLAAPTVERPPLPRRTPPPLDESTSELGGPLRTFTGGASGEHVLVVGDERVFDPDTPGRALGEWLAEASAGRWDDATVPGAGPFQHLATLRNFADGRLSAFVAVWSGADDARQALEDWRRLERADRARKRGSEKSDGAAGADERRRAARQVDAPAAIHAAVDVASALAERCAAQATRFALVLLPTRPEALEGEGAAARFDELLAARLRERGIEFIDAVQVLGPAARNANLDDAQRRELAKAIVHWLASSR